MSQAETEKAAPAAQRTGRVLAVTGAHGFPGRAVIRHLAPDPRFSKILALDVRRPELPEAPGGKLRFSRVDLTLPAADGELAQLLSREGVDTVLHAAFLSSPSHNTGWAHELETIGTMHVLNACGAAAVRQVVMWSQTLVYGARRQNPNFLSEDAELPDAPRRGFIADKIEAEQLLRAFARDNPDCAVSSLRTAPILGPTVQNFATRLLQRSLCPRLLGFDPLVQFVHEHDVLDAFLLALSAAPRGAYNIVGGGVLPLSTVMAMLGRVPLPLPRGLAYPAARLLWAMQLSSAPPELLDYLRFLCVADGRRAQAQLGFRPRYDIRETLGDFVGLRAGARATAAVRS